MECLCWSWGVEGDYGESSILHCASRDIAVTMHYNTPHHTTPHHTTPHQSSPVRSVLCHCVPSRVLNLATQCRVWLPPPPFMLSLILSLSNSHTLCLSVRLFRWLCLSLCLSVWLTLSLPFLLHSSLWLTRSLCLSLFISNRPLFLCLSFSPSFPLSCLPYYDGDLYLIACILLINGFKIPFCDPVQAL